MSRFIPRGVAVAGLGKRVVAALIDAVPVALIVGAWFLVHQLVGTTTASFVGGIIAAVLLAGYALYQWWAYGSRAAGPGAKAMGLQLVGINSGQPIGWWRFFLRQLIFGALLCTIIGGIALLLFTAIHERRQGWHDMAARSIVVQPRQQETRGASRSSQRRAGGTQVGLPPHLSSAFAPGSSPSAQDYSTWAPSSPETMPERPDWMPRIEAEPLIHQPAPQPGGPQQAPQPPSYPAPGAMPPYSAPSAPPPPMPGPQTAPSGPPAPAQQPPMQQPPAPQQAPAPSGPQPPQRGGQPPHSQPTAPMSAPEGPPLPAGRSDWIPLPTPSSIIEPSRHSPRVRPRQFGEAEDDDGGTRLVKIDGATDAGPGPADGWYLRLDDGREVELGVTVLLGRNPQKGPEDGDVHLVPAGGDGRMISRTHVEIGTDARGVYVSDRGSTNGTAVVQANGGLQPCPMGTRVRLREGQQVSYGDRWFTLLRRPG